MSSGRVLTILLLLFAPLAICGAAEWVPNLEKPVVITAINFDIRGGTLPEAVLDHLRIREGRVFSSLERLEDAVETRANILKKRRLFREFDWSVRSPKPWTAEIDIHIVDAVTILPRPIVKYSTSTGLLLGLKVEYFNAFGTLTDQIIESYWSPAEIKGRLDIRNIVMGPLTFDFAFEQFDGSTRYGNPEGDILLEYRNAASEISALMDLQLGAASRWAYHFEPVFRWQYDYQFLNSHPTLDDEGFRDEGFSLGLQHGISTDQVDWLGNFRTGYSFTLSNRSIWHTRQNRTDVFLETDLYGYRPLTDWWEISGRAGGFFAASGTRVNAGDRLRGVPDYMTYGTWGVFANLQTSFRLIPVGRFLELQIRPFFDTGYVVSDEWGPGIQAWEYCAGSTLIFFIRPLPSVVFNMEFGWDFKRGQSEIIVETALVL